MGSKYGAKHNLPGYDKFRTGLTYNDIRMMMYDESGDPKDWKYKRRGTVLGKWHQIKMEMYEHAIEGGMNVSPKKKSRPRRKSSRIHVSLSRPHEAGSLPF